jgi:hypothetical protein
MKEKLLLEYIRVYKPLLVSALWVPHVFVLILIYIFDSSKEQITLSKVVDLTFSHVKQESRSVRRVTFC